jgi:release factor glutamine methyltransferase
MTLHAHLARARKRLEASGIDALEAAVDAEWLARTVLGWDRARLLSSYPDQAPDRFAASYDALVARRERREPAAYIVGRREFWQREFEVGPGVLVPRPETEFIVEEAVAHLTPGSRAWRIADVGTGSGCLAVTLALEFPHARVVATDVSEAAICVARRNAARHGVADRVAFVLTDILAGVDARFDLIVSNPPYVPLPEWPGLPPEVREYEPREALLAGADGLDAIHALLLQAGSRVGQGGRVIFEFGFGQDAGVRAAIAARPAFRLTAIREDLQRIPRTAILERV